MSKKKGLRGIQDRIDSEIAMAQRAHRTDKLDVLYILQDLADEVALIGAIADGCVERLNEQDDRHA